VDTLRFNELNGKLLKACPLCRRQITMVGKNIIADQLVCLLEKFWKESKRQDEVIATLNGEMEEVRKKARRAGEVEVLEREIAALRESASMIGENLEQECKKSEELFARLDQERNQLEEALNQNKVLEDERVRLTKKIIGVREEAEELRTTLENQQAENERLRSQIEGNEKKIEEVNQKTQEERSNLREILEKEGINHREELRGQKEEFERSLNEQKNQLQFELARVKGDQKRAKDSLDARSEEVNRLKTQLEESKTRSSSLEKGMVDQAQKVSRDKQKYEQQQQLLENRIGELETKLQTADRDIKVFSEMYQSTKSTLKEKELQLHQLRRNTRKSKNDVAVSSDGSLMGMMTNNALLTSISKSWWGGQTMQTTTTTPSSTITVPVQHRDSFNQGMSDSLSIFQYSDYQMIEKRGGSKTSNVWKARELSTKRLLALKRKVIPSAMTQQIMPAPSSSSAYYYSILTSATGAFTGGVGSMTPEDQISVFREAMYLSRFSHPNIVRVHGIIQQPKEVYLAMDFVEYDLEYWYCQNRAHIDEQTIKSIFFQVLLALYYVHTAECVHRKLTPTSILLNDSGKVVKLAGFGSSFSLFSPPTIGGVSSGQQTSSSIGFLRYCAPELTYHPRIFVEEWNYWKETDVWSAGCILAEIFLKRPLFGVMGGPFSSFDNNRDDTAILRAIHRIIDCRPTTLGFLDRHPILKGADAFYHSAEGSKLEPTTLTQIVSNASPQALDLLQKMLQVEYQKRIDVLTALHHPWFHDLPGFSAPKISCHLANELTDEDIPAFVSRSLSGV
jgi:negative regulator of PHO system